MQRDFLYVHAMCKYDSLYLNYHVSSGPSHSWKALIAFGFGGAQNGNSSAWLRCGFRDWQFEPLGPEVGCSTRSASLGRSDPPAMRSTFPLELVRFHWFARVARSEATLALGFIAALARLLWIARIRSLSPIASGCSVDFVVMKSGANKLFAKAVFG